jgi:hypothetical protein
MPPANSLLLYKAVAPVSRDVHRGLKLKPVEGFAFAANPHWLPVAAAEFPQAARAYPILFAANGVASDDARPDDARPDDARRADSIVPILLVGLETGRNDFVDAQLKWKAGAYLPAFVRRYPFVLAETGAGDNLTVCFDAGYEGFNEAEGTALFNEDGSNSEFLAGAMKFLGDYTDDMQRTRRLVEELVRLDLLETRTFTMRSAAGDMFTVNDFLAVSEERLAGLKDKDVLSLHKSGALFLIHAHLVSLGNLSDLFDLYRAARAN